MPITIATYGGPFVRVAAKYYGLTEDEMISAIEGYWIDRGYALPDFVTYWNE